VRFDIALNDAMATGATNAPIDARRINFIVSP